MTFPALFVFFTAQRSVQTRSLKTFSVCQSIRLSMSQCNSRYRRNIVLLSLYLFTVYFIKAWFKKIVFHCYIQQILYEHLSFIYKFTALTIRPTYVNSTELKLVHVSCTLEVGGFLYLFSCNYYSTEVALQGRKIQPECCSSAGAFWPIYTHYGRSPSERRT